MICSQICTVYCYFLICHHEYQYLNSFKGQELEITFSLFSVYFWVGAITLLGSCFSEKRKASRPSRICRVGYVSSVSATHERALYCGRSLRVCELWANEDPAPCVVAVSCFFSTGDLKMDSFGGMKGSHH